MYIIIVLIIFPIRYVIAKKTMFANKEMVEKDRDICRAAIGVFQSMLDALYDGTTTPGMLKKLEAKLGQVNKMIEAIDYTPSANGEKCQSPKEVLSKRNHEYKEFRKYREQLRHFCLHINDLTVEG